MRNKITVKFKLKRRAWIFRWLRKKLGIDGLALEVYKREKKEIYKIREREEHSGFLVPDSLLEDLIEEILRKGKNKKHKTK